MKRKISKNKQKRAKKFFAFAFAFAWSEHGLTRVQLSLDSNRSEIVLRAGTDAVGLRTRSGGVRHLRRPRGQPVRQPSDGVLPEAVLRQLRHLREQPRKETRTSQAARNHQPQGRVIVLEKEFLDHFIT